MLLMVPHLGIPPHPPAGPSMARRTVLLGAFVAPQVVPCVMNDPYRKGKTFRVVELARLEETASMLHFRANSVIHVTNNPRMWQR